MSILLAIEKLVCGGQGLARADGETYFVSDVLPGERIEGVVDGKQGGHPRVRPVRIVEPSADRRPLFCPHAGACGGCDWQHIRYTRQVTLKREIADECLRRIGKIGTVPPFELFQAEETGYRRRVRFQIDRAGSRMGFFMRDSHRVAAVDRCPLLCERLNGFLSHLDIGNIPAYCGRIAAIAGGDDTVASTPVISGMSGDSTVITERGVRFRVRGDSFFQQNRFLTGALGGWVRDRAQGKRFHDLYGGCGFFSALLAGSFASGVLVEQAKQDADLAAANLRENGLKNVAVVHGTAEQYLKQGSAGPADCIVVDPSRTGLTETARQAVARCAPGSIVYVSCNPSTQARDLGFFIHRHGYRLAAFALFDLYPNTSHIETAAVLEK